MWFSKTFQIIAFSRNLRSFFGLFFLDTSLPGNQETISIIRKEVLSSSIIEAFLESAPQFILQCSIILRTGIISEVFFLSFLGKVWIDFIMIYMTGERTFEQTT
jgi:hypothetical protein